MDNGRAMRGDGQADDGDWRGSLRRVVPQHPLLGAALAAVAVVLAVDAAAWAGLAVGVMAVALGAWLAGWRTGVAWGVCACVSACGVVWHESGRQAAARVLLEAGDVTGSGCVMKDARGSDAYWVAPVAIEALGVRTKVWWQGEGEPPVAGAEVTGRGWFESLPERRNPGEFDMAAWLRRQGVAAVFVSDHHTSVATGRWAAWGARLRHGFRDRVTRGLPPESQRAAVIRAVVIGESPPDAEALIAAFRNSGTLHVFSVSGLHVAMVGSLGWLVLRLLGMPRRWAVAALLPLIFGYSWITGNSAPAVRSAWMAAVFLGAFVFRRRPCLLNALGAVLLVAMLWDGRMIFQPGVQLSYGVVAAIAIGTGWAARLFRGLSAADPYLPNRMLNRWQSAWLACRRKTSQSLAVSSAAAVGSAPLTAWHFGLVTPVSVLAGLVLVPLVFVLLAAALAAVALSWLAPPASVAINRLNGTVADATVMSAAWFAAFPGGHIHVGGENDPALIVYDLDRGAGAACFSDGSGGAVLLDCGDRQGFRFSVLPSLRNLGIEPDAVVFSHPDGAHLGGGAEVWNSLPIRQVLLPVRSARSPAFDAWLQQAASHKKLRVAVASGAGTLAFPDDAMLEILHAPEETSRNLPADDRVAVYRLQWRGWKVLFTSDAGAATEQKLLDSGPDLAADVIVAGRHRRDPGLGDDFLDAVRPRLIIATHAAFPPEERVEADDVAYWKSRGIEVIHQGQSGGVTVKVDEAGRLLARGFLDPHPVVLNP